MAREKREFYREWSLTECRGTAQETPFSHQVTALRELRKWYAKEGSTGGAGILVLPTGGGKTFTAVQFLAQGPLSEGYKVLWLAHTHHLLEQSFKSFDPARIGGIREPKQKLSLRVVSGTAGHFPPRSIERTDDVVIGTLQTIATAVRENQAQMLAFLKAAGKKLFVIFDEAHHAPAPSFRKLLQALKAQGASALGLTATPLYSDETKQGWLKKLFPSGIIYQVLASRLIADRILARPHAIPIKTSITPHVDGHEHAKWVSAFGDIPEAVIDALAKNKGRNDFIAKAYADNRKKFDQTIIFTDRWYQCEAIATALAWHKIKVGTVYSHVDASVPARERAKRDADENAKVLERFRKRELQVVINVRMLTEGTDIPEVQTVFITRQTTSRILLTQMVGRALRGPKCKGTEDAYIVSFEDDWRQQIQWAGFDLSNGNADDEEAVKRARRPPLQLISIELVRRLAAQMSGHGNVATAAFQTHLPIGWYNAVFDARSPDADDIEPVNALVMVYEDERPGFDKLVAALVKSVPKGLDDDSITLEDHRSRVAGWREAYLADVGRGPTDLEKEIFQLARHVAQQTTAPQFFPFEVRAHHDLDVIAADHRQRKMDMDAVDVALHKEFDRKDRFWQTLFYHYDQFRYFYDGCVNRLLRGNVPPPPPVKPTKSEAHEKDEVDDATKAKVRRRDGGACLACETTRVLEVDHIKAVYHGGPDDVENLQTLCKKCNVLKSTQNISFRGTRSPLTQPQATLPDPPPPRSDDAANPVAWERYLRRTINFFYQCSAVEQVAIGERGPGYHNWTVTLRRDNPPAWVKPRLAGLLERIQEVREAGGKARLKSLRVVSGTKEVVATDA